MRTCPPWLVPSIAAVALSARGEDCNENGVPDAIDLQASSRPFVEAEALSDRRADWIALADMDGDGDDDAILASLGGSIAIALNRGDGTFGAAVHRETAGRVVAEVSSGDMDGDGRMDVVCPVFDDAASRYRISFYPGDGGGGLGEPRVVLDVETLSNNIAGDVDGDGDTDIVVIDYVKLQLLRNRGGARFELETIWSFGGGSWITDAILIDLDGDRRLDIVVSVHPDLLVSLGNQGDGVFGLVALMPTFAAPGWIEPADLDGDGDFDLVVARHVSEGPGEFSVFRNDAGRLSFEHAIPASQRVAFPRLADLDADGDIDIVLAGERDRATGIAILENLGSQDFRFAPELLGVPERLVAPHRVVPFCPGAPGPCGEMALLVAYDSDVRRPQLLRRAPRARSEDCNQNAVPDECERELRSCRDCNRNGIPDDSDVAAGTSADENGNGVPDSCETGAPRFELRFDAPNWVAAAPGTTIVLPAALEIHSLGYAAGGPGINGWSLLLEADGGRIADVTVAGTVAAPAPEGLVHNGYMRAGFLPPRTPPCEAEAAIVCLLNFQEPTSLDIADSPSRILRLAVETTAPESGASALTLGFHRAECLGPPVAAPGDVPPDGGDGGGGSGGFIRTFVYAVGASVPDVSLHPKRILVYGRQPPFHRGDANDDGRLDISDPLHIVTKLFLGGVILGCRDAADANDDARFDISDAIALLGFLFLGGPEPPPPGPPADGTACGLDGERSGGDLGCADYASCR